MRLFRAEVVDAVTVAPTLRRVTLGGPDLREFVSTGVGDEFVRVIFPAEGTTEPVLPRLTAAGDAIDRSTVDYSLLRTYTIRRVLAEEGRVVIDIVMHGHGVGSAWAAAATPGDVVAITAPRALYAPPDDAAWQLLVADEAGLPALARIVELTADDRPTRAVVEVTESSRTLADLGHPRIRIDRLEGGNGGSASRLPDAVRAITLPDGPGYIWVAGEARAIRAIRRDLRQDRNLPTAMFTVAAYWTDQAEEWERRYRALDEETRRGLTEIWDDTERSRDEVEDDYYARLDRLGL